MQLLSHSDVKKNEKKQKNHIQQKKTKQERRRFFLTLCQLYLATLLLKKIYLLCHLQLATIAHKKKYIYCVTFSWPFLHQNHQRRGGCYCVTYSWPFFICFSTCCRALNTPPTVSPLLGTVNSILSRKKMTLNCVTYTCPSSCKKKAGTISKKNDISRHPLPVKLFKILATHPQNSPIN